MSSKPIEFTTEEYDKFIEMIRQRFLIRNRHMKSPMNRYFILDKSIKYQRSHLRTTFSIDLKSYNRDGYTDLWFKFDIDIENLNKTTAQEINDLSELVLSRIKEIASSEWGSFVVVDSIHGPMTLLNFEDSPLADNFPYYMMIAKKDTFRKDFRDYYQIAKIFFQIVLKTHQALYSMARHIKQKNS